MAAMCFSSDEIWSVSIDSVDEGGGGEEIGVAAAGLAERCREAENRAAAVVRVTQVDLRKEGLGLDEALMAREGGGFWRIRYEVRFG